MRKLVIFLLLAVLGGFIISGSTLVADGSANEVLQIAGDESQYGGG